jgi:hypothetical protein
MTLLQKKLKAVVETRIKKKHFYTKRLSTAAPKEMLTREKDVKAKDQHEINDKILEQSNSPELFSTQSSGISTQDINDDKKEEVPNSQPDSTLYTPTKQLIVRDSHQILSSPQLPHQELVL